MPLTVKELREILATLEDDMTVVYPDEYRRSEGWTDEDENATCEVYGVFVNSNGELELQG